MSTILLGVLLACVSALAVEDGPLIAVLQPKSSSDGRPSVLETAEGNHRQKRSFLLGKIWL